MIDDEPIPFGEAFGVNPDGTPYEPPEPEPGPEPTPEPDPTPEPTPDPDGGGDGGGDGGEGEPSAAEWQQEMVKRGFQPDAFGEAGWRTYRELEKQFSSTRPAPPEPTPEPEKPKPSPLLVGEVSEIKTQADLYSWAEADPEAAANWAMENHEALKPDQFDAVMNNWIAQQPWKAITTVQQWNAQILRDEFAERQQVQDAAYTNTMRQQGIAEAAKQEPLLEQYQEQLGAFIKERAPLMALVEGARTPDELKDALLTSFYAMAGPQIARQAMESQVEKTLREETERAAAAEAAAAAEKRTSRASSITRNTAPPPEGDADYDKKIQEYILSGGGRG